MQKQKNCLPFIDYLFFTGKNTILINTDIFREMPSTYGHFQRVTLYKEWGFPLRISSVNMTKSAISWGFGHNYWRNLKWKNSFFCAVLLPNNGKRFFQTSYQTTLILSEDFYAIMLHTFPEFISTNYRNYQTIPTFSKGRYQTIVKIVFNAETFK